MAITRLNSLAIPAGTVEPADISYPLTNFSSTGIDDNATSNALTIDSSERTSFTSASNRPITAVSTDTNAFVTFQDANSASVGHVKIGSETDDMVFYANAQERMRIKGSNVGIGTSSPARLLHLESASPAIRIKDTSGTGTIYELITTGTNGNLLNLLLDAGGAGTSPAFIIKNVGTELMRISSSGNVGIGETTPVGILHLKSDDTGVVFQSSSGVNNRAQIFFQNSSGTQTAKISVDPDGGSANVMAFSTGTSERMRITSSGLVGIGETSPVAHLSVNAGGSPDATYGIANFAASAGNNSYVTVSRGNNDQGGIKILRGSVADLSIHVNAAESSIINYNGGDTNDGLFFRSGSAQTEVMALSSSGYVGIGTTSPDTNLHIYNAGQPPVSDSLYANVILDTNSTTNYQRIRFDVGTTPYWGLTREGSTNNFLISGRINSTWSDTVLVITPTGRVGIGTSSPLYELSQHVSDSGANYHQFTNTTTGTTSTSGFLVGIGGDEEATLWNYSNTHMRFATNSTERMRINSLGALCVGLANSTIGSGNIIVNEGVYVGAANGDYQIRSSSAGGGSATLYIGNAAIQVSSDRRLKENIVDTSMSALEKLDQVRVVDFTWNDPSDTAVNNKNARGMWTGIIAQELVDVFPFAVNAPRNEDDLSIDEQSESTWQVDQDQLVPVLIKAIQELKAEVAALKGA